MHTVYKGDRVMNTLQDLIKKYASQYKEQVGNAVPVNLAYEVALEIRKALEML